MSEPEDAPKTAVIIEDDLDIRNLLEDILKAAGFRTIAFDNGLDGVRAVQEYDPAVTTLDVNLPDIDGHEVARRIRRFSPTVLIMLSGLKEETDIVFGLAAGADEYVVKPFRPRELRARIEALLRRPRMESDIAHSRDRSAAELAAVAAAPPVTDAAPAAPPTTAPVSAAPVSAAPVAIASVVLAGDAGVWLVHHDLRLEPSERRVTVGGRELALSAPEFDLLAALMESKRRVRSKADLTLVLRGEQFATSYYVGDADKRAIEAHVAALRAKLGDDAAEPRYFEAVREVGYRLTA